jgi:hypothetical protein
MEPEQEPNLQPEPSPKPISKARLIWRMTLLPIAFSWIGFALMAPLALIDDRFAWGGVAFGLAFGIALLIVQPKWAKKILTAPVKPERKVPSERPVTTESKVLMTVLSVALAIGVGSFLVNTDLKDRSIFVFMAVMIVIDMIRRPLRRAWGIWGSAGGIMISGGLIVLLIKAISGTDNDPTYLIFGVILLAFDVFEEYRSLKRSGQLSTQPPRA